MGFQIERLFILSTGGAINSQWQRKGHPSAHRNILGKTNFHYFSISSLLLPPPLSFSLSFSPLPPGKPDHPQPVSTQFPLIPAGIVSMAGLSRRVTYVLSSVRHHRNGICSSQKVLCPSHLFRNPSQHHCLLAESSLVAQPPIYLCWRRRHKRPSPQHPALSGCLAIIRFTRSEDHSRSGDRAWDQRAYEAGPLGQAASLLLHGSLLEDVKTRYL